MKTTSKYKRLSEMKIKDPLRDIPITRPIRNFDYSLHSGFDEDFFLRKTLHRSASQKMRMSTLSQGRTQTATSPNGFKQRQTYSPLHSSISKTYHHIYKTPLIALTPLPPIQSNSIPSPSHSSRLRKERIHIIVAKRRIEYNESIDAILHKDNGILLIQREWRKHYYAKYHKAAIAIQKVYLGYSFRKCFVFVMELNLRLNDFSMKIEHRYWSLMRRAFNKIKTCHYIPTTITSIKENLLENSDEDSSSNKMHHNISNKGDSEPYCSERFNKIILYKRKILGDKFDLPYHYPTDQSIKGNSDRNKYHDQGNHSKTDGEMLEYNDSSKRNQKGFISNRTYKSLSCDSCNSSDRDMNKKNNYRSVDSILSSSEREHANCLDVQKDQLTEENKQRVERYKNLLIRSLKKNKSKISIIDEDDELSNPGKLTYPKDSNENDGIIKQTKSATTRKIGKKDNNLKATPNINTNSNDSNSNRKGKSKPKINLLAKSQAKKPIGVTTPVTSKTSTNRKSNTNSVSSPNTNSNSQSNNKTKKIINASSLSPVSPIIEDKTGLEIQNTLQLQFEFKDLNHLITSIQNDYNRTNNKVKRLFNQQSYQYKVQQGIEDNKIMTPSEHQIFIQGERIKFVTQLLNKSKGIDIQKTKADIIIEEQSQFNSKANNPILKTRAQSSNKNKSNHILSPLKTQNKPLSFKVKLFTLYMNSQYDHYRLKQAFQTIAIHKKKTITSITPIAIVTDTSRNLSDIMCDSFSINDELKSSDKRQIRNIHYNIIRHMPHEVTEEGLITDITIDNDCNEWDEDSNITNKQLF